MTLGPNNTHMNTNRHIPSPFEYNLKPLDSPVLRTVKVTVIFIPNASDSSLTFSYRILASFKIIPLPQRCIRGEFPARISCTFWNKFNPKNYSITFPRLLVVNHHAYELSVSTISSTTLEDSVLLRYCLLTYWNYMTLKVQKQLCSHPL